MNHHCLDRGARVSRAPRRSPVRAAAAVLVATATVAGALSVVSPTVAAPSAVTMEVGANVPAVFNEKTELVEPLDQLRSGYYVRRGEFWDTDKLPEGVTVDPEYHLPLIGYTNSYVTADSADIRHVGVLARTPQLWLDEMPPAPAPKTAFEDGTSGDLPLKAAAHLNMDEEKVKRLVRLANLETPKWPVNTGSFPFGQPEDPSFNKVGDGMAVDNYGDERIAAATMMKALGRDELNNGGNDLWLANAVRSVVWHKIFYPEASVEATTDGHLSFRVFNDRTGDYETITVDPTTMAKTNQVNFFGESEWETSSTVNESAATYQEFFDKAWEYVESAPVDEFNLALNFPDGGPVLESLDARTARVTFTFANPNLFTLENVPDPDDPLLGTIEARRSTAITYELVRVTSDGTETPVDLEQPTASPAASSPAETDPTSTDTEANDPTNTDPTSGAALTTLAATITLTEPTQRFVLRAKGDGIVPILSYSGDQPWVVSQPYFAAHQVASQEFTLQAPPQVTSVITVSDDATISPDNPELKVQDTFRDAFLADGTYRFEAAIVPAGATGTPADGTNPDASFTGSVTLVRKGGAWFTPDGAAVAEPTVTINNVVLPAGRYRVTDKVYRIDSPSSGDETTETLILSHDDAADTSHSFTVTVIEPTTSESTTTDPTTSEVVTSSELSTSAASTSPESSTAEPTTSEPSTSEVVTTSEQSTSVVPVTSVPGTSVVPTTTVPPTEKPNDAGGSSGASGSGSSGSAWWLFLIPLVPVLVGIFNVFAAYNAAERCTEKHPGLFAPNLLIFAGVLQVLTQGAQAIDCSW